MAGTRRQFGQLRQLPSGRWQVAYTGPDGNRHKARRTFATDDDAIGWLNIERRKIELGNVGCGRTQRRHQTARLRQYLDRAAAATAPDTPALRVNA